MSLWIETLSPRHKVLSRSRFDAELVRVGRGYANQFFVDDVGVAPEHLRIEWSGQGRPVAHAVPGCCVRVMGQRGGVDSVELGADTVLLVGRSRLRVRTSDDDYEAVDARLGNGARSDRTRQLLPLLGCVFPLVLAIILSAVQSSQLEGETESFGRALVESLMMLFAVVPWVAFWALLSQVFTREPSIGRHLQIAGIGTLVMQFFTDLLPYGAMALSMGLSHGDLTMLGLLVALGIVYAHLRVVNHGQWFSPVMAAVLLALVSATGAVWYREAVRREASGTPDVGGLAPIFLRLVPVQSRDQTLKELTELRGTVEAERAEPLPEALR